MGYDGLGPASLRWCPLDVSLVARNGNRHVMHTMVMLHAEAAPNGLIVAWRRSMFGCSHSSSGYQANEPGYGRDACLISL
jgi:N-acyl-D-aspartate/D-glutamate deacylase